MRQIAQIMRLYTTRQHELDHTDHTDQECADPTRQYELDHTDQEYICFEISSYEVWIVLLGDLPDV